VMSGGDSADPVERAIHFALHNGPSGRRFQEAPAHLLDEFKERLHAAFTPLVKDGAVRVPGKAWMVQMVA